MTVEERLECLERRANRYRNEMVLLVMSVCSVALIGATSDDGIITGKGLFITNDEGVPVFSVTGLGIINAKGIFLDNDEGVNVLYVGAHLDGHGTLRINSKTGQDLIWAGASPTGNGFYFRGFNKRGAAGSGVVQLYADDYGNGVVGAYNRKGKGRTLESGP